MRDGLPYPAAGGGFVPQRERWLEGGSGVRVGHEETPEGVVSWIKLPFTLATASSDDNVRNHHAPGAFEITRASRSVIIQPISFQLEPFLGRCMTAMLCAAY